MKTINDTIHGQFNISGVREDLLNTPEINKLSHIKQLGLAHLVFPGAHHTRFEHSLGVSHVAGMMADSIKLNSYEKLNVEVAGMLHDVGHGPYSHTLEHILHEQGGLDHMSITEGIILGEYDIMRDDEKSNSSRSNIPDILESHDLDPKEIANLIRGPNAAGSERSLLSWTVGKENFIEADNTLSHLVHGPVDCDQIDYLMRDSHFTGVKHGVIDHRRLISSMARTGGDIAIKEGGITSLEGMLMARGLMYSAVYFHRVTRVTEVMLSSAVERSLDKLPNSLDMQKYVDSEVWGALNGATEYSKDIVKRFKYRNLLKVCLSVRRQDLSDLQVTRLIEMSQNSSKRRSFEDEIASRAGLMPGYVIIDMPNVKLLLSEPRMAKVDIKIIGEDGKIRWLREHTPIADALRSRHVSQSAVYVMTLPSHMSKVSSLIKNHLLN